MLRQIERRDHVLLDQQDGKPGRIDCRERGTKSAPCSQAIATVEQILLRLIHPLAAWVDRCE